MRTPERAPRECCAGGVMPRSDGLAYPRAAFALTSRALHASVGVVIVVGVVGDIAARVTARAQRRRAVADNMMCDDDVVARRSGDV